MPNPTTERLAREQDERLAAYAAEGLKAAATFASAIGALDTSVSLGADAEQVAARPHFSEPVCVGCAAGYHADPLCAAAPCACPCHTPHQQRGTRGGRA